MVVLVYLLSCALLNLRYAGAGMTPEAVKKFIDNYMPAYAAYRGILRSGFGS